MFRFIAKLAAKIAYRWKQEREAETNLLNAGLASQLAQEKRDLIARITKEADDMDARIKEVAEMEMKGFWVCENGHEEPMSTASDGIKLDISLPCSTCKQPMQFIKRDQMSGKEIYESDKDRGEAEKIAQSKRDQAKQLENEVSEGEKAAKYFRELAKNNRTVAEKVRRL